MTNTTGTMDATRRIPARLSQIGASLNFFGRCVGLSSGEISSLFSSRKKLTGDKARSLLAMVSDLEMLAQAFSPCPVLFKDHELILDLIRQLKDGSLMVGKMRNGTLEVQTQILNSWNF